MTVILIAAAILIVIYRQFQAAPYRPRDCRASRSCLIGLGAQSLAASPPAGALAIGALTLDAAPASSLGVTARPLAVQVWRAADGTWWRKGTVATAALGPRRSRSRVGIVAGARAVGVARRCGGRPARAGVRRLARCAVRACVALRSGLLTGALASRAASDAR